MPRLMSEAQAAALSAKNRAARRTPLTRELEAIQKITAATREAWNNPDDWAKSRVKRSGKAQPRAPEAKRVAVPERDVLRACIAVLETHPAVRLWWRQNTAALPTPDGKRFIRFSFKGASDLMIILRGGMFMACEVKATGKRATPAQQAFLDNVLDAGGYAICVDDAQSLADYLRIVG